MFNQADQSYSAYQHQIIKELKAEIVRLTKPPGKVTLKPSKTTISSKKVKYWNLPYVFEITSKNEDLIKADEPFFLYIRDDESRGLRVPGQAGYIKNDGPGTISYRLNNGSELGWSYPATLKKGEIDTFDYNDNIQIVIVEITADTDKTRVRTRFTPGFVGDSS